MKKLFIAAVALFTVSQSIGQAKVDPKEVTNKNSWLKAGLSAGVPIGDLSDASTFALGLEVSGQFMRTPHFGLGIASGYTHYFGKDGGDDFGAIPLGLMLRYYPMSKGFFAGVDGGYSFITNIDDLSGGAYVKPQLGYHNYSWNIYGFYNHIFTKKEVPEFQTVGIAATYNIRFK